LGFLFAEGTTYQEAEDALRTARRRLRVVIQQAAGPRG